MYRRQHWLWIGIGAVSSLIIFGLSFMLPRRPLALFLLGELANADEIMGKWSETKQTFADWLPESVRPDQARRGWAFVREPDAMLCDGERVWGLVLLEQHRRSRYDDRSRVTVADGSCGIKSPPGVYRPEPGTNGHSLLAG